MLIVCELPEQLSACVCVCVISMNFRSIPTSIGAAQTPQPWKTMERGFHQWGYPIAGWFILEHAIKMDDWRGSLFKETPL